MSLDPKTILQIFVLAVGSHIALSALRTTRGSGMVRGVLIALVVVFGGLLGVARWLDLAELRYIVETLTGFVVVILAVVFQPELRRGIVSLGDNPLLRTVIGSRGGDVVEEVAAACVAMGKRRQGALIAFERNVALDVWTQKAVKLDARVSRHLLDSIFNSGSPLHDGAVIVREGRIAAAMAILPLSERENLARSIGTRHRAALGLAEETDAIVVAVSEETGLITVCQAGSMERKVAKDDLIADLRARLGGDESRPRATHVVHRAAKAALGNLGQKALALGFGVALYYAAFRSVRNTQDFNVQVEVVSGANARSAPSRGVLRIILPAGNVHLEYPRERQTLSVTASAPQATLASLAGGLGGVLIIEEEWIGNPRSVPIDAIQWGLDRVMEDLDVRLLSGKSLEVRTELYESTRFEPVIASFYDPSAPADGADSLRGIKLPPGVEVDLETLEFDPPRVTLRGPSEDVMALVADPGTLRFESVQLIDETGSGFVARLRLDPKSMGRVTIEEDLFLRGGLQGTATDVGQVSLEVALVSFDPARPKLEDEYRPPTETISARVLARGLFGRDLDATTRSRMGFELLNFVRQNARVFVDVGRAEESPGSRVEVEVASLDQLWPEMLGPNFSAAKANPTASVWVELDATSRTVALEKK